MPRVLILLSESGPWGAVRAVRRAAGLLPGRFEVQVHEVRKGWRNWWATRRLVIEAKPDVVHAVGSQAADAAVGITHTLRRKPRFVVSSPDPVKGITARLARGMCQVLPISPVLYRDDPPPGSVAPRLEPTSPARGEVRGWPADEERGAPAELLPPPLRGRSATAAAGDGWGEPQQPHSRFLLAAGGFDRTANLKAAVWAFDVLKYAEPDLHLVLLGDGPQRAELEHLARNLGREDYRVHFAGWQPDVGPYLRRAAAVWVTHRAGGTTFALEAMAAGMPVVALKIPDTEAIIRDDGNGLLVPFGDPVRLAAVTRELLADAGRRDRIGCAGRATASGHPVGTLVEAVTAVYDRLTRTAGPMKPE